MTSACPFCQVVERETKRSLISESEHAIAFFDIYPVSQGHALVIPRRHCADLFELNASEQTDVWNVVASVYRKLKDKLSPDGFNIGVNVGAAAGQTVHHAHVHIIPRTVGDVDEPRGGVRWVIPQKAVYW